jgi:hypothetical protein
MKRMGTRALAMAGVLAVVLMVGSSAQARRHRDYRYSYYSSHTHDLGCGQTSNDEPVSSVPEPSAALVFGVGLLVARGFARRSR